MGWGAGPQEEVIFVQFATSRYRRNRNTRLRAGLKSVLT
ncbi:hypothetical protein FEP90_05386 [Burkholderia multivorans]|nr:hypothetical protein [Burkholderia multivorans]MDR8767091.1 hypothetical protein [Burkholderia multivorans]MDR8772810.1 hypothetical protein [Burkholderia multivorans]MDR8789409.1 hypothetical protein [Burkholderia multivorans]MDR8796031.1 hypothetical protein [Burkholderia multivorans]